MNMETKSSQRSTTVQRRSPREFIGDSFMKNKSIDTEISNESFAVQPTRGGHSYARNLSDRHSNINNRTYIV